MKIKRMSERLKLYEDFLTEAEEEINLSNFTAAQKKVIKTFFNVTTVKKNLKSINFSENKFLVIKNKIDNLSGTDDNDIKPINDTIFQDYLNPLYRNPNKYKSIISALNNVTESLNKTSIDQNERKKELIQKLEKPLKIMVANIDAVKQELSDISTNKHSLIANLTDKENLKNTLTTLQDDTFDFSNDLVTDVLKAPDDLSDFITYLDNYDTTSDKFALYVSALKNLRDIFDKDKNLVKDINEEELATMKSNALKACDGVIKAVNDYLVGTTKVDPSNPNSENKLEANIKNFDNLLMQGEDKQAEQVAVNFLNDIETNNFGVYTESFSLYEGMGETVKDILGKDFLGWIKAVKLGQLARTDNPFVNLILKNKDLWDNNFCDNGSNSKNWFLKIYNWIITYKISGGGADLKEFIANSKVIRAVSPLKEKQLLDLQDVQFNYMVTQEYDYWKNNGNSLEKLDYKKLYNSALNLKRSRWGDFEQSDELERTIGDGGSVGAGSGTGKQLESNLKDLAKKNPADLAKVVLKVLAGSNVAEKNLRAAYKELSDEEKTKIKGGLQ